VRRKQAAALVRQEVEGARSRRLRFLDLDPWGLDVWRMDSAQRKLLLEVDDLHFTNKGWVRGCRRSRFAYCLLFLAVACASAVGRCSVLHRTSSVLHTLPAVCCTLPVCCSMLLVDE
jgi:hypothetical protein